MALKYYAGDRITGTASDKNTLTSNNLLAGTSFLETDTSDLYHWDGNSWELIVGNTVTETLSSKTLTTPTVSSTGFANANHAHAASNSGGAIAASTLTGDVVLGSKTSGNYVATITGGTGITSNGATSGEGIAHSLSVNASQGQIVGVGALDAGSITSNFGNINIGSSTFTTTGAVSVGNLTVTGTTTTVNASTTTYVDPIITLQTVSGGGVLTSDTNKDVGIAMQYHNGSAAKTAFLGFDDTDGKLMYVPDATISGSEVVSGSVGTIKANLEGNVTGDITGSQSLSSLTVDNLNLNGNTVSSTSGALIIDAHSNTFTLGNNEDAGMTFEFLANRSNASSGLVNIDGKWNNTLVARIAIQTGGDNTNKDDAHISFMTASAGSVANVLVLRNDKTIRAYGDLDFQQATEVSASGHLTLSASSGNDVLIGEVGNTILYVDGGTNNVGVGAITANAALNVGGTFQGDSFTSALRVVTALTDPPGNGTNSIGVHIATTFTEVANASTTVRAGLRVVAPTVTAASGASVATSASVYISGPTSGGATPTSGHLAFLVDAGTSRFDGDVDLNSSGTIINVANSASDWTNGQLTVKQTANNTSLAGMDVISNAGVGASMRMHGSSQSGSLHGVNLASAARFTANASGGIIIDNQADAAIYFADSGGINMTIDSAGRVKVGASATGNAAIVPLSGNVSANTPHFTWVGNYGTGMRRAAGDTIAFDTGAVERLRIDSAGNVGIGATSPNETLHVVTSGSSTYTAAAKRGLLITDANGPRIGWEDTGEGSNDKIMSVAYESENLIFGSMLDDGSNYDVNNILVLNRDGNVGIGVSAPTSQLQVAKAAGAAQLKVTSHSTDNDEYPAIMMEKSAHATLNTYSTVIADNERLGLLMFRGSNGSSMQTGAYIGARASEDWDGSGLGTDIYFVNKANNSTSEQEVMTLASTGNVTIGSNASIGEAIDTYSRFNVGGSFTAVGGTNGFVNVEGTFTSTANADSAMMRIAGTIVETGSGTHGKLLGLRINAPSVTTGNATVTNTATLFVSGAMSATVTGANYALWVDGGQSRFDSSLRGEGGTGDMYLAAGSTGIAGAPTYSWTGDTDTGMYRATTNQIGFSTNSNVRLTLADSSATFAVPIIVAHADNSIMERSTSVTNASTTVTYFRHTTSGDMADGFGPALQFQIDDAGVGPQNIGILEWSRDGADNSGKFKIQPINAGSLTTNALVVNKSGNVGIGTSNPFVGLSVENSSLLVSNSHDTISSVTDWNNPTVYREGIYLSMDANANSTSKGRIAAIHPSVSYRDLSIAGLNLYLNPNGVTAMTLLSGGQVGIGTAPVTNFEAQLYVKTALVGADDVIIRAERGNVVGGGLLMTDNASVQGIRVYDSIHKTSGPYSGQHTGVWATVNIGGDNTQTFSYDQIGFYSDINAGHSSNPAAGSVSGDIVGFQNQTSLAANSSTTTAANSIDFRGIGLLNGTVTHRYGLYVQDTGGTVTNQYGVLIENMDGASTLNYAIYAVGGKSYFGGAIGIGAAVPAHANYLLLLYKASADITYMNFSNSSTGQGGDGVDGLDIGINGAGNAHILQRENLPLNLSTNNAARIIIAAGGNVGIGTDSSPDYLLDVQGTGRFDGTLSVAGTSEFLDDMNIQSDGGGGDVKLQIYNTGTAANDVAYLKLKTAGNAHGTYSAPHVRYSHAGGSYDWYTGVDLTQYNADTFYIGTGTTVGLNWGVSMGRQAGRNRAGFQIDPYDFTDSGTTSDIGTFTFATLAHTVTWNSDPGDNSGAKWQINRMAGGTMVNSSSAQALTNAMGATTLYLTPPSAGSNMTFTNASGINIANVTSAGTTTNLYGIYIDAISGGATNWGIFVAGSSQNFFGGKVGIGTTSIPAGGMLRVQGKAPTSSGHYPTHVYIDGAVSAVANNSDLSVMYMDGVTYSAASARSITNLDTLFIANAPTDGTNVTATNKYALRIANGDSYFGGIVTLGGNSKYLEVLEAPQNNGVTIKGNANPGLLMQEDGQEQWILYAAGSGLYLKRDGNLQFGFFADGDMNFYGHIKMKNSKGIYDVGGSGNNWVGNSLTHSQSVAGSQSLTIANTNGTNATSTTADLVLSVSASAGNLTGDPLLGMRVGGGANWCLGVDNSDSDLFAISSTTTVGGIHDAIHITTGELVTFNIDQGSNFDYWCDGCGKTALTMFDCCGKVTWHDDTLALARMSSSDITRSEAGLQHMVKIGVMDIKDYPDGRWTGVNMQPAIKFTWDAVRQNRQRMDTQYEEHENRFSEKIRKLEALLKKMLGEKEYTLLMDTID